jgi:hypothetical protein
VLHDVDDPILLLVPPADLHAQVFDRRLDAADRRIFRPGADSLNTM